MDSWIHGAWDLETPTVAAWYLQVWLQVQTGLQAQAEAAQLCQQRHVGQEKAEPLKELPLLPPVIVGWGVDGAKSNDTGGPLSAFRLRTLRGPLAATGCRRAAPGFDCSALARTTSLVEVLLEKHHGVYQDDEAKHGGSFLRHKLVLFIEVEVHNPRRTLLSTWRLTSVASSDMTFDEEERSEMGNGPAIQIRSITVTQ
jgi:hypothetical protein